MVPVVYNPEKWNRFTYVINNPLNYIDPEGNKGSRSGQHCPVKKTHVKKPKRVPIEMPERTSTPLPPISKSNSSSDSLSVISSTPTISTSQPTLCPTPQKGLSP